MRLIRTREQALNTRLFDRDTRSVQLTPEGPLFEPSARQLLGDFVVAVSELGVPVERRKGRANVAALPSLPLRRLSAIFVGFKKSWPGLELKLSDMLSDLCLALVRGGKADFALASTRTSDAGLSTELLCTDPFYQSVARTTRWRPKRH